MHDLFFWHVAVARFFGHFFVTDFLRELAMVSNMMKTVWILVVAWGMRGIDSVDDESDVSHRRRRELGHHVHGDLYDAASSDSAPPRGAR